jgi:hypothetical protein
VPLLPSTGAADRPRRAQRWAAAVAALVDRHDQYRAWLDNLTFSLEGSRLADKLLAITESTLSSCSRQHRRAATAATDIGHPTPNHPPP